MWVSTTKYFSPSFSYIRFSSSRKAGWVRAPLVAADLRLIGDQVETELFGRVFGIGEHDRPVVLVDHPTIVGRHVLLELGGVEEARLLTERLRDLVVDDVHASNRVHADHRRPGHHLHVVLCRHDLGDDGPDLIVHEGEAAHVGRGVVGPVLAFDGGFEIDAHWVSSFGSARLSWVRMPLNRDLARSRPSSKRGGLKSGWDHSGWRVRDAEIARGTHTVSHPSMIALLWSANSRSLVNSSNIAMV